MYEKEKSTEIYSSGIVRKKSTIADVETSFRDLAFIVSGDKNQEEIHFLIEEMCWGGGNCVINQLRINK